MKCNNDYDLVGFLNNEVTDEERSHINRHIAECSDCLRELADIRTLLDSLADAPQIEPSRDFTGQVLASINHAPPIPVCVDASAQMATWLDILKYYLKRSPPWAFSTALHAIILAVLSLVFVNRASQGSLPPEDVSHWVTVQLAPLEANKSNNSKQLLYSNQPSGTLLTGLARPVDPVRKTSQPECFPGSIVTTVTGELSNGAEPRPEQKPPDVTVTTKRIDRKALAEKLNKGEDKMAGSVVKWADKQMPDRDKGEGTESAVASGLKWLASVQEPTGKWIPSKFNGRDEYIPAMTGLSTLCFTAQGNSHLSGEYSATVDKAIQYLISIHQPDGLINPLGANPNLYNHGIATYALLEDYLIAQSNQAPDKIGLEDAVVKAVSFIINAQSASGGWGYEARSRTPDTSITVWQIRVLRLASVLDIPGTEEALYKSRQWLNYVTNDDGLVGYQARLDYPNKPDTLTAAGLSAYLMIDSLPAMNACQDDIKKRLDTMVAKQSAHVLAKEPMGLLRIEDDGGYRTETYLNYDLCYWYWTSPDLMASPEWNKWNESLKRSVLMGQTKDGRWKVEDKWSIYGGEIYTTSMALLTLQASR